MALQIKTFRISDSASEDAVNSFLGGKRVHHWEASYNGDPSLGSCMKLPSDERACRQEMN